MPARSSTASRRWPSTTSSFDLYYWPQIQGRGEFVRLALEASGTPFRDVAREDGVAAMMDRMAQGDTPPFAPPFLVHGRVVVAQVAAILFYLGPRLDLAPADEAARLWCHQVQLTITDLVAEVHDTHHPLGNGLYYEDQKPEAKRRAAGFVAERMPKFLGWLERVAERSGSPWLVGEAVTTADLSAFQAVEGLSYAFPKAMRRLTPDYPRLLRIRDAVASLPAVAAYLASDRRVAFNEDGIFRHYRELDR